MKLFILYIIDVKVFGEWEIRLILLVSSSYSMCTVFVVVDLLFKNFFSDTSASALVEQVTHRLINHYK